MIPLLPGAAKHRNSRDDRFWTPLLVIKSPMGLFWMLAGRGLRVGDSPGRIERGEIGERSVTSR